MCAPRSTLQGRIQTVVIDSSSSASKRLPDRSPRQGDGEWHMAMGDEDTTPILLPRCTIGRALDGRRPARRHGCHLTDLHLTPISRRATSVARFHAGASRVARSATASWTSSRYRKHHQLGVIMPTFTTIQTADVARLAGTGPSRSLDTESRPAHALILRSGRDVCVDFNRAS